MTVNPCRRKDKKSISKKRRIEEATDHHFYRILDHCLPTSVPYYRPRSIYQYSNMAPRLSGQTSIFDVVFFGIKVSLWKKET